MYVLSRPFGHGSDLFTDLLTLGRQTDSEDFREGILGIASSTELKASMALTTTLDRRFWLIYPFSCDFFLEKKILESIMILVILFKVDILCACYTSDILAH